MELLAGYLDAFQHTALYLAMLLFFGFYPVLSAVVWLTTSFIYFAGKEKLDRDKEAGLYALPEPPPKVSVLIPAHCEEKVIAATLEGALRIDYPDFEIVVVDDGSTDATVDRVAPYV